MMRSASRSLRWAIKIAAPDGPTGDVWGDAAFADDLARALRRRGQRVRVDRREHWYGPRTQSDDVALVLRGLDRFEPQPDVVNLLWVISHPDDVGHHELRSGFDRVWAAGPAWAQRMRAEGSAVEPLLQATDPRRFRPRGRRAPRSDVLFVGTTRGVFRPIVRDAVASGADLSVYGHGWGDYLDPGYIRAERLDNRRLPAAYRGARVVLNDHWEDMARTGFLSNRLFDAVAAGARVVSDDAAGIDVVFGDAVETYRTQAELAALLDPATRPALDRAARRRAAADVAARHSFDARAAVLVASARAAAADRRGLR